MALLFVFESLILVHAMDNTIEFLVALLRTKPCMSLEVFLISFLYSLLHCKQFPLLFNDRSVASGLQCLHLDTQLPLFFFELHHYYLFLFFIITISFFFPNEII